MQMTAILTALMPLPFDGGDPMVVSEGLFSSGYLSGWPRVSLELYAQIVLRI